MFWHCIFLCLCNLSTACTSLLICHSQIFCICSRTIIVHYSVTSQVDLLCMGWPENKCMKLCSGTFYFSSSKNNSELTALVFHYFPHRPWQNWGIYHMWDKFSVPW
jgi:hypothetical protein